MTLGTIIEFTVILVGGISILAWTRRRLSLMDKEIWELKAAVSKITGLLKSR